MLCDNDEINMEPNKMRCILENPLPKSQWKSLITKHVHQYWKNAIEENMLLYTSLKYLDSNYNIGRIHPLLKSQSANIQGIRRIPTRLKIVTGTYILQTNRAVYSTHLIFWLSNFSIVTLEVDFLDMYMDP
jgi:hypothetical protein